MDFFQAGCQTGPHTEERFGLCDDQHGGVAYVDTAHQQHWVATVENRDQKPVTFTAIDKCVIQDGEYPDRGRCDGMLTTNNQLYLVELKDKKTSWQSEAIKQLESTIQFLQAQHPIEIARFKAKKAFACNKQHQVFTVINQETKKRFFDRYRFRLDLQATIVMVE